MTYLIYLICMICMICTIFMIYIVICQRCAAFDVVCGAVSLTPMLRQKQTHTYHIFQAVCPKKRACISKDRSKPPALPMKPMLNAVCLRLAHGLVCCHISD